jgi:OmpA-OmpF porin, OOP family
VNGFNMMTRRVSFFIGLLSISALAQTPVADFSLERFSFNDGQSGALSAASGTLLKAQSFRVQLAGHYERNPLVLTNGNGQFGRLVAYRFSVHLNAAYSPLSWLQIAAELPIVADQGGDNLGFYKFNSPQSFGIASPKINVRLGILSQAKGGLLEDVGVDLAFQLGTALPVGSADAFSKETSWAITPRLSIGRDFGPVRLGADIGFLGRTQPVSTSGTSKRDLVGNQFDGKIVVSTTKEMLEPVAFELSFHSGIPVTTDNTNTPMGAELLAGARFTSIPWIEPFVLGGPGFGQLPGTPSWRLMAGLALVPPDDVCAANKKHTPDECPELDDDKDGIANKADKCPVLPEDADGFDDSDGCADPDNDADGVLDANDKCINIKGLKERQGCPLVDTDKDGIEDSLDKCPKEFGPKDRKGCPLIDTDKDGIEDADDKCPTEPGDKAHQGCPVADGDNDGVADAVDNCPKEPGPASNQGCPEKQKQLVVITADKLVIKDRVFFDTGKATIQKRSFGLLDQVASVLVAHPEVKGVNIEGHTDSKGKEEMNRKLSQNRAASVLKYLSEKGVEASRMKAIGYGPDQPIADNATEAGRELNRRVEFVIQVK